MVFFELSRSSTSAFIDKEPWYKEAIQLGLDYFGNTIDHEYLTPVVDGGSVYHSVSEALQGNREPCIIALGDDHNIVSEGKVEAYDGNNWESFTAVLLGKGFSPYMTDFGGQSHLPSGNYATSLLDAYAMMFTNTRAPNEVVEYQEADSDVQFILGLRFKDDPQVPRFQGLKLTVDNKDRGVNFKSGTELTLRGKHSPEQIQRWVDGYAGVFQDGTVLLDLMGALTMEDRDYIDPSEVVRELSLVDL